MAWFKTDKHLLGRHEQSRHGNRGGSSATATDPDPDRHFAQAVLHLQRANSHAIDANYADARREQQLAMTELDRWSGKAHARSEHRYADKLGYALDLLGFQLKTLLGARTDVSAGALDYPPLVKSLVDDAAWMFKHLQGRHDQSRHDPRKRSGSGDGVASDIEGVPVATGAGTPRLVDRGRPATQEDWARISELMDQARRPRPGGVAPQWLQAIGGTVTDPLDLSPLPRFLQVFRDPERGTTLVVPGDRASGENVWDRARIHDRILDDFEVLERHRDMFPARNLAPGAGYRAWRPAMMVTKTQHWFRKHTPGGKEHKQELHGRRGGIAEAAAPGDPSVTASPPLGTDQPTDFAVAEHGDRPLDFEIPGITEAIEAHGAHPRGVTWGVSKPGGEITDPDLARAMAESRSFPVPSDPRNGNPELAARIAEKQRLIAWYRENGMETSVLFDSSPTGYHPARKAMHAAIVTKLLADARAAGVKFNGEALFSGGLPGAGKTYVLKSEAGQAALGVTLSDYLNINADDVKSILATGRFADGSIVPGWEESGAVPAYEGLGLGKEGGEIAPLLHLESSHISSLMSKAATAEGMNILWDFTMSSDTAVVQRLIELVDAIGPSYRTRAMFVDVALGTSVKGAIERYQNFPRDANGERAGPDRYDNRLVYFDSLSRHGVGKPGSQSSNRDVFDSIRHLFNEWYLFENPRGGAPSLIDNGGTPNAVPELEPLLALLSVGGLLRKAAKAEANDTDPLEQPGEPTTDAPQTPDAAPDEFGTGILTLHFMEYAAGRLSYDNLRRFVLAFPFKPHPDFGREPPADPWEDVVRAEHHGYGKPMRDTSQEVDRAWAHGLISQREYDELNEGIAAASLREQGEPEQETATLTSPPPLPEDALGTGPSPEKDRFREFSETGGHYNR